LWVQSAAHTTRTTQSQTDNGSISVARTIGPTHSEKHNFERSDNSSISLNYWEKTVDRIFEIDERIRYVGIVDMAYHVIASQMRPGISSLTPTELDWNFVSIVPRTMLDSAKRLENDCGPFEIMTIRYRKAMIAIYRGDHYIIMLSFEPSVETPFLRKLTEELDRIRV